MVVYQIEKALTTTTTTTSNYHYGSNHHFKSRRWQLHRVINYHTINHQANPTAHNIDLHNQFTTAMYLPTNRLLNSSLSNHRVLFTLQQSTFFELNESNESN